MVHLDKWAWRNPHRRSSRTRDENRHHKVVWEWTKEQIRVLSRSKPPTNSAPEYRNFKSFVCWPVYKSRCRWETKKDFGLQIGRDRLSYQLKGNENLCIFTVTESIQSMFSRSTQCLIKDLFTKEVHPTPWNFLTLRFNQAIVLLFSYQIYKSVRSAHRVNIVTCTVV